MTNNKPNEYWASGFALGADYNPRLDCKPTFGVVSGFMNRSLKSALAEDPCEAKFYFHVYNKDHTALLKKYYTLTGYESNCIRLFDDYESAAKFYNKRIYKCLATLKTAQDTLLSKLLPET